MMNESCSIAPPESWGSQKPPLGVGIDRGHPLSNSLVGYWALNEAAGKSVRNSVDGIAGSFLYGNWATSQKSIVTDTATTAGPVRTQLVFRPTRDFSLFAVIYAKSRGDWTGFMGNSPDLNDPTLCLGYGFISNKYGLFVGNGTYANFISGNSTCALNEWHTVGMSWKSRLVTFYLDGKPNGGGTAANDPIASAVPWHLGALSRDGYGTYLWNGQMAAAGIWQSALTAEDHLKLHAHPYSMFESGFSSAADVTSRPRIDGSLASDSSLLGAVA
jgi:hypothetical protein